jgi:hypothetical protein
MSKTSASVLDEERDLELFTGDAVIMELTVPHQGIYEPYADIG